MTTIWIDSRKRAAGRDEDFEFDIGETVHLQGSAWLGVFKIRVADTFLSTDRGAYLYWKDTALGTLNWAQLPTGAYTGVRLAAWISSNFASATYGESTNEITVAHDGNRIILNDQELRAHLANAADTVGPLGHDIIAKIICKQGVGYIMESDTHENHMVNLRGPITLRHEHQLLRIPRRLTGWSDERGAINAWNKAMEETIQTKEAAAAAPPADDAGATAPTPAPAPAPPAAPAAQPQPEPEPAPPAPKRRGRPPGSKNKPKPKPEAPPTAPAAPAEAERPAAAVPAPVAEPEPEEPEEPPMTPAQMRVVRQLSRADRFEELLTRNTMEV
eukprot:s924_g3.t2